VLDEVSEQQENITFLVKLKKTAKNASTLYFKVYAPFKDESYAEANERIARIITTKYVNPFCGFSIEISTFTAIRCNFTVAVQFPPPSISDTVKHPLHS